ncbi:hypothetical protein [Magnetospira sp. QH-2]|uniref:DUF6980 family protein n=1 Tax=Magnetospira sp. (strain QH-2) TaxID=1288970 RepID=UPI000697CDA5|nr:hypothetical protein [Magnetospira sp. QH-2]
MYDYLSERPVVFDTVGMCSELKAAVEAPNVALVHIPQDRHVGLIREYPLQEEGYNIEWVWYPFNGPLSQEIDFCPWTGNPMAGYLGQEWCEVLFEDHGIDCEAFLEAQWKANPEGDEQFDREAFANLPQEMQSEAWWRTRKWPVTNPHLMPGSIISPFLIEDPEIKEPEFPFPRPNERPERHIGLDGLAHPGYARPPGHPPHMCNKMKPFFDDEECMIAYLPHVREYGIRRVADLSRPLGEQPLDVIPISFCPWCGRALPPSLRPRWEAALAKQKLTPDCSDIPEDYLTEAWWYEG